MKSEKQSKLIEERILRVCKAFLESDCTIEELSQKLKISSSTIQRDLNHQDLCNLVDLDVYNHIQEKLQKNKKSGLSKGGIISNMKNEHYRDDQGRFSGNKKR